MPLVCIGLSHRSAPLEVREHHAFPASRMGEALMALHDYQAVREAVMLQTCGRLEIYAELEEYEAGVAQLRAFLQNFGHGSVAYDLDSYLYTRLGSQAVEHLFRVSTGLDSMLLGEAEILGQVKEAHAAAQQAGSLGTILHRLFREAMSAGKAARTQTRIGEESASVATAAIDLAKDRLGSLDGCTVTIIGAGKMGRTAAKRLRAEGARNLIVTSRTMRSAHEVVRDIGSGSAIAMDDLTAAVSAADVVVTSTGASHFILHAENVAEAMAGRAEKPLLIVDIAVPRDVNPGVADLPGVSLFDIDALKSHVDHKLAVRHDAIPQVEEIIGEYVERFRQWYQARPAIPVVASLTQKAEAIRAGELERLFARCPELSEREKMLITGASLTIISKLLHTAVTKIRERAAADGEQALEHARLVEELFELQAADESAPNS